MCLSFTLTFVCECVIQEEKNGHQAMNNHYLYLPVAPLSADAVLTVMETLDSQQPFPSLLLFASNQGL